MHEGTDKGQVVRWSLTHAHLNPFLLPFTSQDTDASLPQNSQEGGVGENKTRRSLRHTRKRVQSTSTTVCFTTDEEERTYPRERKKLVGGGRKGCRVVFRFEPK